MMCPSRRRLSVLAALTAFVLPACERTAEDPFRWPATAQQGAPPSVPAAPPANVLTRLMFQDRADRSLKWADVRINDQQELSLGLVSLVADFPKLDAAKQNLVQMREHDGLLLVGVRDDQDGGTQSGWVLVHTGVGYTDHGDHGHWTFKKQPDVWDSRLDQKQGNPAHVYLYDGRFFLANDRLNGYTRIDPNRYEPIGGGQVRKDQPRFLKGGGNHITLAVLEDWVGYACWIDFGGPNQGRVDVTPLAESAKGEPAYSFRLPTGGIHGAIANSGKVFFAPADGICWVAADPALKLKPDQVKVHHIPLGKDGDRPRRTGAFVNHGRYVLCVTGKEGSSSLVLLDAKEQAPRPIVVPLDVKKGTKAVTPAVAVTPEGRTYAFVFHDREPDADAVDVLEIVALDPDENSDCRDARVLKTLPVGRSAVEGHYGHHDIAFDANRRYALFTNPGDGTISVLSLKTLTIVATLKVGGMPTAIVAHGGRETDD